MRKNICCAAWLVFFAWTPVLAQAGEAKIEGSVNSGGVLQLTLNGRPLCDFKIGVFERDGKSVFAAGDLENKPTDAQAHAFKITAPNGAIIAGEARIVNAAGGGLEAQYKFTPAEDVKLNTLHVLAVFPSEALAGCDWSADGKHGEFPKNYKDEILFNNAATKSLTIKLAQGEMLKFAFSEPSQVQLEDHRKGNDATFTMRIGPLQGNRGALLKKGQSVQFGFTLNAEGASFAGIAVPAASVAVPAAGPAAGPAAPTSGDLLEQDFEKVDLQALPAGWSITSDSEIIITEDPRSGKILAIKHKDKGEGLAAFDIALLDLAKARGHAVRFAARIKFPGGYEALPNQPNARPQIALLARPKGGKELSSLKVQFPEPEKEDWQNMELICPIDKDVEAVTASVRIPLVATECFVQRLSLVVMAEMPPAKAAEASANKPPPAAETPASKAPASTMEDTGLLFNAAIATALRAAMAKSPAVKTSIAFIGPGLPQKELDLKVADGWTLLNNKNLIGAGGKPRNLLAVLPDYLCDKKPEMVVLFGDLAAGRKISNTEYHDWVDLARLCLRLGAVPVLAVPPQGNEKDEKDLRKLLLKAAAEAGCPAIDLKRLAQVSTHIARLGGYIEKYVFDREPPSGTLSPQGAPDGGAE